VDLNSLYLHFEYRRVKVLTRAAVWMARTRPAPRFEEMSTPPDAAASPPLDRDGVDEAALSADQRAWRRDGVVVKPGFIPADLVDAYVRVRAAYANPIGWTSPVPYMHVPELRAISLHPPLMALLRELMGADMFLHLNLTSWISTERNWHQDDYLNPDHLQGWYLATWVALDDIHPDSGPFEYVPGSHRWPVLRGEKVRGCLTPIERNLRDLRLGMHYWPKLAERITTPAIEDKIRREGRPVEAFLARKGDLLVWHARLMHRGSPPRQPGMPRRALISHYSAVGHRPDLETPVQDENGSWYAPIDKPLL